MTASLPFAIIEPTLLLLSLNMDSTTEYLSQEKYDELTKELEQLKTVERKKIAEHLDYAKSLGDLSENAEYHEARDKQADIEDRIQQLELILKNAEIIAKHDHTIAEVGSVVTVVKNGQDTISYQLVGSEEVDINAGKISHQSPIGSALLGHKKGDAVTVTTPKGNVDYKITNVK